MPTSSRFVLATHILASLAMTGGTPLRSQDLAFSMNTNASFVRSLLSRLQAAGLTSSQLGFGGGAILAKPPAEITLQAVYKAVEDEAIFALHRQEPNQSCVVGRNIQAAIRPTLDLASHALEDELASVTIFEIAERVARLGKITLPWKGC